MNIRSGAKGHGHLPPPSPQPPPGPVRSHCTLVAADERADGNQALTSLNPHPTRKPHHTHRSSARDAETGETLAIKKISNAFVNPIDAKRTLRELRLLKRMSHENVVSLRDIMKPPGGRTTYNDVYVTYELMDTDLHQIIRSNQVLSEDHCQYFVYQLLRGLKYVHSANVLHRDLKPSNLLLNANCDLKLADFGLARNASDKDAMTEYVVTRWYRAPELLLSCAEYTPAIDVWSVGCILAELLMRRPLFPGTDYVHQLNLITAVTGVPSAEDMAFVRNEKARAYIRGMPPSQRVPMRKLAPDAPPLACDLVDRCLAFDPAKRITVCEALEHPFLESLHDETDEPLADFTIDEQEDLQKGFVAADPRASLRELVYLEIMDLHPDLASTDMAFDRADRETEEPQAAGAPAKGAGADVYQQHGQQEQHYVAIEDEEMEMDSDFMPTPVEGVTPHSAAMAHAQAQAAAAAAARGMQAQGCVSASARAFSEQLPTCRSTIKS